MMIHSKKRTKVRVNDTERQEAIQTTAEPHKQRLTLYRLSFRNAETNTASGDHTRRPPPKAAQRPDPPLSPQQEPANRNPNTKIYGGAQTASPTREGRRMNRWLGSSVRVRRWGAVRG